MKPEDISIWIKWAEKQDIHPAVLTFIRAFPNALHSVSKHGPCPAMWMNVSQLCKGIDIDAVDQASGLPIPVAELPEGGAEPPQGDTLGIRAGSEDEESSPLLFP